MLTDMYTCTCSKFLRHACNVLPVRSITQQQSVSQPLQTLCVSVWDSGVERKSRLLPSPAAQKGFSLCKNGKDDDDGLPHASGSLLGLKNMLTHQRCRQNGVLNYLLSLCCRFYEHNHFYFRFLFEEQEQILHRRTKKFCQGDRTD